MDIGARYSRRLILGGMICVAVSLDALAGVSVEIVPGGSGDPNVAQLKSGESPGPLNLDSGTLTFNNGTVSAIGFGDDVAGVTKVAASFNLSGSLRVNPAISLAFSDATIGGLARLTGPGTAAVPIRLVYKVDGFFTGSENAQQGLLGTLSANQHQSQLSFAQDASAVDTGLKVSATGHFFNGTASVDDPSSVPIVNSASLAATPGALDGELQTTVMLAPGGFLTVSAGMNATIGVTSDEPDGTTVAKAGVNALNTGTLTILIPHGYSFSDAAGTFLGNPSVVLAVPEPSNVALFIAGLIFLALFAYLRSRWQTRIDTAY